MKKDFLKGTPVPKVVTILFFLWALGFAGVVYFIYQTETQAEPLSFESRYSSLFTDQ